MRYFSWNALLDLFKAYKAHIGAICTSHWSCKSYILFLYDLLDSKASRHLSSLAFTPSLDYYLHMIYTRYLLKLRWRYAKWCKEDTSYELVCCIGSNFDKILPASKVPLSLRDIVTKSDTPRLQNRQHMLRTLSDEVKSMSSHIHGRSLLFLACIWAL